MIFDSHEQSLILHALFSALVALVAKLITDSRTAGLLEHFVLSELRSEVECEHAYYTLLDVYEQGDAILSAVFARYMQ